MRYRNILPRHKNTNFGLSTIHLVGVDMIEITNSILIYRNVFLYDIKTHQWWPICSGALPVTYVPVWVTRGALIAHRYTFPPPRCRTSQYRRAFILLSVSLCNYLVDPVFDGVGLAGFKSRSNAFLLA